MKVRSSPDGVFNKVALTKLGHIEGLREAIESIDEAEGVIITDRTIVVRNTVFCTKSASSQPAVSEEITGILAGQSNENRSTQLSGSTAIAYRNVKSGSLVVQTDPGRRGNLLTCTQLQRAIKTVH